MSINDMYFQIIDFDCPPVGVFGRSIASSSFEDGCSSLLVQPPCALSISVSVKNEKCRMFNTNEEV
jgi:hypothetical protein